MFRLNSRWSQPTNHLPLFSYVLGATLIGTAMLTTMRPAAAQVAPSATAVSTLPSPLSLRVAIQIALQQQPQEYIARTQQTQAKGQEQIARAQYFPTVTPSYQYQNITQNNYGSSNTTIISTGTGTSTAQTYSTSSTVRGGSSTVTVSQTLFDNGSREVTNAQARRAIDIANYNRADIRQQIVLSVTEAYYNLLRQIDQVKVSQADVDRYQQTVTLTRAQATAGTAAPKDVLQAEASLASAQITLIQDQNTIRTLSASLKNVMGVAAGEIVQPVPLATAASTTTADSSTSSLGSLPVLSDMVDTKKTFEQYVQEAFAKRLDLKEQEASVSSSDLSVRSARLDAGLQVSGTYNYTYTPSSDLGSRGTGSSLLATFSYPLFDAGSRRASVHVAEAQRDAAKNQLEQDRQNIRLNIETYFVQRSEALQRLALAQTAIHSAQTNYDAAVASRQAGVASIIDVTTAQVTLTTTQNQYVGAIYDFYIADADLKRATGNIDEIAAN